MTISEGTPLLQDYEARLRDTMSEHDLIYERFSPRQKRALLQTVSLCALLPLFISASIYPSIPAMVEDFHSTPQIIGLAVSISVLSSSIGALIGASCSTFYGRRPVYLLCLPLLIYGSLGVALSRTVGELLFFRVWQAVGASPGYSIGAGVIGDVYKIEERGTAMGIFLAATLMGLAIAPVAGGLIAFGVIWFYFPETSHPEARGIDKLRRKAESGVRIKWTSYVVNPFSSLGLLRAPNVLAVSVACFTVGLTFFVLMVPLAYTLGAKYNIKNVAILGACAIPGAIGEMIGAPLSGYLSDRIVAQNRRSRGGVWYPEDRLRAALAGAYILVPLSMVISGIVTEHIEGPTGVALDLACFFLNGFGVELVLSPVSAYIVDILRSRGAEAAAVYNGFRYILFSLAISGIIPMIDAYGVMATNIASALLAWLLGFGLLWLTIQYGESMRAWCDVGFSTAEDN